jgi:hypothetical protein
MPIAITNVCLLGQTGKHLLLVSYAAHSQAELNKVARQLNERPRKTLDFQSPAERFSRCVAATG